VTGRGRANLLCLDSMNRQEIIAVLDAEIARLQSARDLVAQSLVNVKQTGPPQSSARASSPTRLRSAVIKAKRLAPSQAERQTQLSEAVSVPITRLPAKEAPRQRLRSRDNPRAATALTGVVPNGPVAAPRKSERPMQEMSASTFGEAISRGFATTIERPALNSPSL